MPYCTVGRCKTNGNGSRVSPSSAADGIEEDLRIFYERYGHGSTKILFIIGLAGDHKSWGPQVAALCGTETPNSEAENHGRNIGEEDDSTETSGAESNETSRSYEDEEFRESTGNGIEVCTFDNRGVGNSSIPMDKSQYSTRIMAEDTLSLLDHLGWEKAHVVGHSMGGMIACKLAAMAPHRLASLTLIGVTGGGYQCFPKLNRQTISIAYRLFRAKTPEGRAAVDLETHYTHDYLETTVGETKRRVLLFQEYVTNLMSGGMQPRYGLEGQASACWNHSMSSEELETIRSAGVFVAVVHGRGDIIAQVEHARKLAKKLHPVSQMVELHGGHLLTHSNTDEVNGILLGVVGAARMTVKVDGGVVYAAQFGGVRQVESAGKGEQEREFVDSQPSRSRSRTVISDFWRKVRPQVLQLLNVLPFLRKLAKWLGIDRLWQEREILVQENCVYA